MAKGATCTYCGHYGSPKQIGYRWYCAHCDTRVVFAPAKPEVIGTNPLGGGKRYHLIDRKGEFMCAFHDLEDANQRVRELLFRGIRATVKDTKEELQ